MMLIENKQAPRRKGFLPFAILTLAFWQLRRTWFLLLMITLGMIAAVVIVCTLPLLSDVMLTAGLRSTLRATPDSAHIMVNTQTNGISSSVVRDVHNRFDALLHGYLGKTIAPSGSSILCNDFSFSPAQKNVYLTVYGTSLLQARPYLGSIQGQSAQVIPGHVNELEVMLTPSTAEQLKVHVGSSFKLLLNYNVITPSVSELSHSTLVTAHVVGLFAVTAANAAYWHGENFEPLKTAVEGSTPLSQYTALVSDQALLALFDSLSVANHTDAILAENNNSYTLNWHYQLNVSSFTSRDLNSLIGKFAGIETTMDSLYGGIQPDAFFSYPYLTSAQLSSPVLSSNGDSILEQFRSRVTVVGIPTGVFTILISALILFFVSLITTQLVDRQTATIALLRSRGASRGQIFGALFLQSIVQGILALLVGLLLTFFIVLFLAQHLLPPTALDALNILTSQPVQAMLGTIWYALAIILIVLLTMGLSLFLTARMDVLALRRESARSNRRPFWQRFYLDVLAGVIALTGYGFLLYVTSVGTQLQGNVQVLVTTPLSIIAPFFLLIGCLFLFLRIFPWLLRLGTQLAARGRGAVSLLALAQMARAPRQPLRMTLLLSLATAFALFTLVYVATQNQHVEDIVAYQAGADFSIQLQPIRNDPVQILKQYQSIPGVLAASTGYSDQGYGGTANLPMEIRAVDANNFERAVIWSSPKAFQAAHPLLSQMVSLRSSAPNSDIVPVVVDQTVIKKLLLHVGSALTVTVKNAFPSTIHCVIIGIVDSIPTINTLSVSNDASPVTTGGVLMDYQTYFHAYQQDVKSAKTSAGSLNPPTVNQVWLRTTDNPAILASLRASLDSPTLHFISIADRRLLLSTLQSDPLYLILDGVLTLGTITALLLALIGGLLVSWVSARSRLINIVTLRALGSTPGQVAGMFAWEQAIVSLMGFILGGGSGLLLATSVIPALTFTDLNSNLSNEQFFTLQSALSAQIVLPPTLPVLAITFIVIYIASLLLMVGTVLQPALGRTLRVNED